MLLPLKWIILPVSTSSPASNKLPRRADYNSTGRLLAKWQIVVVQCAFRFTNNSILWPEQCKLNYWSERSRLHQIVFWPFFLVYAAASSEPWHFFRSYDSQIFRAPNCMHARNRLDEHGYTPQPNAFVDATHGTWAESCRGPCTCWR
jgi:hypothetical protein